MNTIIVSDLHLHDAEPPHPRNPLWKRFKRRKLFIDRSFGRFLDAVQEESDGPIELILNGDIFDFDSIMVLPEKKQQFRLSWLEKSRGMHAQEPKSVFKINVILNDHRVWIDALRKFALAGNSIVFVIGNHDLELHWPAVQKTIRDKIDLPEEHQARIKFCEWFYISNGDTLIEHGNQYDAYCLCHNPIRPTIRKGKKDLIRLPFGNLAGKYMTNGMGLFNPHVESSYIKSSLKEYLVFFYKYIFRVQPFLMFTWLWGAVATMFISIQEGLLPPVRDPLTLEKRINEIAAKANATPETVRSLRALQAHPAIFNPWKVLRELWLDRLIIFGAMVMVSFWFFSTVNVFANVSILFFIVPLLIGMPLFIFYARGVESEVYAVQKLALEKLPISTEICKVKRAVHGHTHRELHTSIEGVEILNTGTWSAAYLDAECTQPVGNKCFAWIKGDGERVAGLFIWQDPGFKQIQKIPDYVI